MPRGSTLDYAEGLMRLTCPANTLIRAALGRDAGSSHAAGYASPPQRPLLRPQRWNTQLFRDTRKPLDHFPVQRDAVGAAFLLIFVFG